MARQKGPFTISGTLGDINYYIARSIGYKRKAGGGFDGYAIKTKASMQPVRDNYNEFGTCSRLRKHFRLALSPFLIGITGKLFHSRMMQLFLGLKALDGISERGKRTVKQGLQTTKGQNLLKQYAFTYQTPLLKALTTHGRFNWERQQLAISDFNPSLFKKPKATTHIGLTLGILDFDFDSLASSLHLSPTYFLDVRSGSTSFDLIPNTVLAPIHFGVAVLGIRFYSIQGDALCELPRSVGAVVLDCLG
ncbi:hypothetical protein ACFPH8_05460 [Bizionia hallyeonensis]|uniref:Uncharacterized protein n=1 Tax=Bizionia hallyeonensis TaxID=1123757 RepID=A0ABW0C3J4_9FLAO